MRPHAARTKLRRAAAAALIVLFCVAAFGRGTRAEFVSDDTYAIVNNPWVSGPLDATGIFATYSWWGPARADAPGYRPLTTLSFALDHAVGGLQPFGYHAVNIVLHACVCLLVWALATALGFSPPVALASALLFAILPIHSEAVIWPVGRAELLAALGFLGSVCAGLRYLSTGKATWLAASAGALVLGALSKENAVTALAAPLIFATVRRWRTSDTEQQPPPIGLWQTTEPSRELLWLAALVAGLGLYLYLRSSAGSLFGHSGANVLDNPLSVLSWWQRPSAALAILGRYLRLSVFPYPLSVDYSFNALGIGAGFVADLYTFVALIVSALCAFGLSRPMRRPQAAAAILLLSLAAYSIVSNTVFLIGTGMAERLFYLPSVGLCIAGGCAFGYLYTRWPRSAAALLTSLLLVYTGVDAARCGDWVSPLRLFAATVHAVPNSARARMELASAYGRTGQSQRALAEFATALEIKPDYAAAAYNRANMLVRLGHLDAAEDSYRLALQAKPAWSSAQHNLAMVRRMRGDIEGALAALQAPPGTPISAPMESLRGDLLLAASRPQEAAEAYTKALAAGADQNAVLVNRGVAYERALGCSAAVDDYLAATRVRHPIRQSFVNAAACLRRLGRTAEAAGVLARSRVANPPSRR